MEIQAKDLVLLFVGVVVTIIATKLVDKYIPNWSKKRLEKKYQNKLATQNEIKEVAESMDKINYYAGLSRHYQLEVIYTLIGIFVFLFLAWDIPLQNRMFWQTFLLLLYSFFIIGFMFFLIYDRMKSKYYKYVSDKAYELYRSKQKENGNTVSK